MCSAYLFPYGDGSASLGQSPRSRGGAVQTSCGTFSRQKRNGKPQNATAASPFYPAGTIPAIRSGESGCGSLAAALFPHRPQSDPFGMAACGIGLSLDPSCFGFVGLLLVTVSTVILFQLSRLPSVKQRPRSSFCGYRGAANTIIITGQLLPDAGVVTHGRRPQ